MLKRFFQNTRRPDGFGGKVMAALMNSGHASVASWGFLHFSPAADGKWVKMLDGMTIYDELSSQVRHFV
jgi:hypothetical protein